MAYDIVIGRDTGDKEKFGDRGLVYIGKGYVKMGNYNSLSNKIWLDVARNHVILISGKRGSGKSYTLSAIAEELSALPDEISKNIASIIFDTMGIFWTMKYENEKDAKLLEEWGLKSKKLPVKVFVPFGRAEDYLQKKIPFDSTFALKVSELEAEDWITLFGIQLTSLPGVLIEKVISELKERGHFNLNDIVHHLESDSKASHETKEIASSFFKAANTWGIFSKTEEGTEIKDLLTAGTTTVLDTSVYSSIGAFNIRALVISLISRKIFKSRMDARKKEEIESIQHGENYLAYKSEKQEPLVWIFIDECHEYLAKDEKTPATDALIQLLREGRQPGISMVMATQQPAKLHADVFTQSDIIISHRVTSKPDIEALNAMMQSYSLEGIKQQFDDLPSTKGSAILLDDNSERIYPIRVRPKFTWHGGESPSAIQSDLKI
jgi:DNA helicase HerA-like ATPase